MSDHVCINGARRAIAEKDCVACLRAKVKRLTAERDAAESELEQLKQGRVEKLLTQRDEARKMARELYKITRLNAPPNAKCPYIYPWVVSEGGDDE